MTDETGYGEFCRAGQLGCRAAGSREVAVSFPIKDVSKRWGRPTMSVAVPVERFEQYAGQVPDFLLDLWRGFGFAGFRKGLLWLCDPVQWQPTVDAWTSDLDLPFGEDTWVAVSRSAFGRLSLWGRRTGLSLTITPHYGQIFPVDNSENMSDPFSRDVQILANLEAAAIMKTLDEDADDDKPLFKRVLKRLGPVGPTTMYGFVPALALGGPMLPNHVEIVDAAVHMEILRQVTPRTLMLNPYR
ncbi:GAD-like domain-containing protein [Nocardia sp. NPDC059228]|uniref:GAD-like domain-containing protein n=1 Tax=Nocardia sp. NPDC059228 TaxID=3346777 RepID=UPI0036C0C7A1